MRTTAISARKKPRPHRPAGEAVIAVKLPRGVVSQIDRWRRKHGAKTRAEAVGRLVKQALATEAGRRRVTRKLAATASELAGQAIDRVADQSATSEERATRKGRLIKGPRELRAGRRDLRN
jgi:metal-responsive CopG/Arc/MetJ family transcriptional regulator